MNFQNMMYMQNKQISPIKYLSILMLSISFLYAQPESQKHSKEQLESMRIAFYTREMELSPQEATLFWPIYNQLKSEESELRKKSPMREHGGLMIQFENMSEEEATKILDQMLDFASKENALRQKYVIEIAQKLSRKKALQFIVAEKHFRKELVKHIQERKSPHK